jgi:hypothetical protein
MLTRAQELTIRALHPVDANYVNVDEDRTIQNGNTGETVTVAIVRYECVEGNYSDSLGQYLIHAGGSYVGSGHAIPDAWYVS